MKKRLSLYTLLFAGALIQMGCGGNGYTITGDITGDAEGKTVYLYNNGEVADSTVITDGRFEFSGELPVASQLSVKIFPDETRGAAPGRRDTPRPTIPLFVDKGKVTIAAVLDSIPTNSPASGYDYSNISVSGPGLNRSFMDYMEQKKIEQQLATESKAGHYIHLAGKPVSEGIAAVEASEAATKAYIDFAGTAIARHGSDPLGPYILRDLLDNSLISLTVSDIDTLVSSLSKNMAESEAGKAAVEKAMEIRKSAVGAPYIDLTFTDAEGNEVKVSDYAGKGEYVMLEFWASWCGPCRWDIPHLKHMYELYHPAGFNVISVSIDEDHDKWIKAMEEEQMPWLQLTYPHGFNGDLHKVYNFNGIPACVLIDPDGIIADRGMRGSRIEKSLIELFGNRFGDEY